MGNRKQWFGRLVFALVVAGSLVSCRATAQEAGATMPDFLTAKDPKLAYRLDLITGRLGAIKPADMKVGCIYYHYCPRRGAWAWSYVQSDRTFWYAFGEGTTQIARRFDVRATQEDINKRLEQLPALAQEVNRYNQSVCLRLQGDGRWTIVGTGMVPSIFNVETGERWEQFGKSAYIPIIHTHGAIWTIRNGRYEKTM
jgi:hypothetical protein